MWVFCYGIETPEAITQLAGGGRKPVAALLDSHRRVFRGYEPRLGGGAPSIVWARDYHVHGFALEVGEDLAKLDAYFADYKAVKQSITCFGDDGEFTVTAVVYVHKKKAKNDATEATLTAIAKVVNRFWATPNGAKVTRKELFA